MDDIKQNIKKYGALLIIKIFNLLPIKNNKIFPEYEQKYHSETNSDINDKLKELEQYISYVKIRKSRIQQYINNSDINILGSAVSNFVGFLVIVALNLITIHKKTNAKTLGSC